MGASQSSIAGKVKSPAPWSNDLDSAAAVSTYTDDPQSKLALQAQHLDPEKLGSIISTTDAVEKVDKEELYKRICRLPPKDQFYINSNFPSGVAVFFGGMTGGRVYNLLRTQMGLGCELFRRSYVAGLIPSVALPAMFTIMSYKLFLERPMFEEGAIMPKQDHIMNGVMATAAGVATAPFYVTSLCVYLGLTYDFLETRGKDVSMRKSILSRYSYWLKKTSRLTLSSTIMTALYFGVIAGLQYDAVAKIENEKNLMPVDFVTEKMFL